MVSWGEPEHMTKPEYCTRPNVDEKRPEEEITTASRKNTGDGTGFGINVIA